MHIVMGSLLLTSFLTFKYIGPWASSVARSLSDWLLDVGMSSAHYYFLRLSRDLANDSSDEYYVLFGVVWVLIMAIASSNNRAPSQGAA